MITSLAAIALIWFSSHWSKMTRLSILSAKTVKICKMLWGLYSEMISRSQKKNRIQKSLQLNFFGPSRNHVFITLGPWQMRSLGPYLNFCGTTLLLAGILPDRRSLPTECSITGRASDSWPSSISLPAVPLFFSRAFFFGGEPDWSVSVFVCEDVLLAALVADVSVGDVEGAECINNTADFSLGFVRPGTWIFSTISIPET